jgi:hypothetical protein
VTTFVARQLPLRPFPHGTETPGPLGDHIMGMAVLGWLTERPVATWGEEWMRSGFLHASFSRAIAADQLLDVDHHDSASSLSTTYRDARGRVCVVGAATLTASADHEPLVDVHDDGARITRLAPRVVDLESATMPPLSFTFDATRDLAFLDGQPDAPEWQRRGWAHPAWLGTASNAVIMGNIDFDGRPTSPGRWLQVSADIGLVGPILDGDDVELRSRIGRITNQGRHGRHRVAHLECTYRVETRIVARLRNSFVFATDEPSPSPPHP